MKMSGEEVVKVKELSEEERRVLQEKVSTKEAVPKRFSIRMQDIKDHGATEGCGGCKSMFTRGVARQAHTEACRRRFEREMADDERVKASVEREKDFVAREVERDVEARKAKEGQAVTDRSSSEKRHGDVEIPKQEPMRKRCKEQHVQLKDQEAESKQARGW